MTSNEDRLNSPEWMHAWERVLKIVPEAKASVPSPFHLTPDLICNSNKVDVHSSEFVRIPNYETLEDVEIYDIIFSSNPMPPGEVIFLPDDCFRHETDPYTLHSQTLRQFVDEFPKCVFDGDVLFISETEQRISMFHHEGGYLHISVMKDDSL